MKNSFFPNNPSWQADSYQNIGSPESPFTSSNHYFSNVENQDDHLFNFACHTNEDIIEMTSQIQKNYFPSKLPLEDLKTNKSLDGKIDSFELRNNDLNETLIKEKSLTEERQNFDLKEITKEISSQENHPKVFSGDSLVELKEETSVNDSENNSAYTEEYDTEISITTDDTESKTFEDKQTQTSPIILIQPIPLQENSPGPLELLQNFSLSPNNIIVQNNELEAKGLQVYFLIHTEPDGSKTFVQPVYFIQSSQILNDLQSVPFENDTGNNIKEFER